MGAGAAVRTRADPYRAAFRRVTRYVVTQLLAGNDYVVRGLEMYYVLNLSPSDVATVLRVPVGRVRGWLQRVHDAGLGAAVAARVAPAVLMRVRGARLTPLLVPVPDGGGMLRCRVCGASVPPSKAAAHVVNKHRDIVMRYVDALLPLLSP